MARHDYAKRTTTRKKKKQLPGWVWMLGGLMAGLFIAFLVYLQQANGVATTKKAATSKAKPATTAKAKQPATEKNTKEKSGINFDFYNILPELEVVIPDIELGKNNNEGEKATYYLQVGSFKSVEEAEARKAELILLNFNPSIQQVTIDNSQTWHRVRLGPFTDRRAVDKARRNLQDNGIDFIMLKDKS